MLRTYIITFPLLFLLVITVEGSAWGQSPSTLGIPKPDLTPEKVERLVKALPEVLDQAAAYQAQFIGGLTGTSDAQGPQLSEKESAKLVAIIEKHGFSLQDFALGAQGLIATYFVLVPQEFDTYLPTEKDPNVRAVLDNPKASPEKKKSLRRQLDFVKKNKELLREQLTQLVTESGKQAVMPYRHQIKQLLEKARRTTSSN
ncbi:MAG: hypothetical protein R3C68_05470 [Myxococcota bacterium]